MASFLDSPARNSLERRPWKLETILPGHPRPDQYEVVNFSPYKVHQRLAERMHVGRSLLAADVAYLCNPLSVPRPSLAEFDNDTTHIAAAWVS